MDEATVTFGRRGATLILRHEPTADGIALIVVESGRRRTFPFRDPRQLARFQQDMEDFLRRTGWSPVDGAAANTPPADAPAAETPCVALAVVPAAESGLRLTLAEEEAIARR